MGAPKQQLEGERPVGTPVPEGTMVDATERDLGYGEDATPVVPPAGAREDTPPKGHQLIPAIHLEPGSVVPGTRYRIVRWLGTGSMGIVYEAAHVDIERKVALKILRPDTELSVDAAATFRREARTASQIGAPNIIEIVDFAQLPDGRLLFAMELLDGQSLAKLVELAPIPLPRLIGVLRQICKGLAAAHKKGVVHRDIKPDNVMLARKDNREDFVKIVDFGISSLLAAGEAIETAPAGTPFYMAPEQIEGHGHDGRADLYALGCTAYALMTGHPPFVARTLEDVFQAHLSEAPLPPRSATEEANYPPALEALVLRLLAKSPEDRFADADAVEAALCEVQIESGVSTAWDDLPLPDVDDELKQSLAGRMPRPMETAKRSWLWPVVAALSVVVAGGVVASGALSPDPAAAEQRSAIEVLELEAKDAAARAYFVYPPPEDRDHPTAYTKVLELERREDELGADARERAQLLRKEFAATLVRLGDHYFERDGGEPFAMDYYTQALVFDGDTGRARERTYITFGQIASLSRRAAEGEFTESELRGARVLAVLAREDSPARDEELRAVLEEAPALPSGVGQELRKLVGKPKVAKASLPAEEEADAPEELGEFEDSETDEAPGTDEAAAQADPKPEVAKAKRDPKRAKALTQQGATAKKSGDRAGASKLFHQALAQDPRHAPALYQLAELAFDDADYNRAANFGKKAVQYAPKKASYRLFLGDLYVKMIRYPQAREQYEKAEALGSPKAKAALERLDQKMGK